MKKIVADIDKLIADLTGNSDHLRINMRARQVRERYKLALEAVYKDMAPLFLQHTNNVYIMKKNGVRTLIVYVDESIYAAELNAQRELIKLKLLENSRENIEKFEILVSRGPYKKNYPYETSLKEMRDLGIKPLPLEPHEQRYVYQTVSTVEDASLQKSFERAMTASMGLNKAEMEK